MKAHPTAELFPLITGQDFEELCASIKCNGLLEAIVKDGDEIIDGRNRFRACSEVGVAPRFVEWADLHIEQTKSSWILAKNVTRRHLTDDQRAMIWTLGNKNVSREMAEQKKQQGQFKKGQSGNPTGKAKGQARTDSCEPARDHKKEHANSTVGQVAAGAGVSHHKASQAVDGPGKCEPKGDQSVKPKSGRIQVCFGHINGKIGKVDANRRRAQVILNLDHPAIKRWHAEGNKDCYLSTAKVLLAAHQTMVGRHDPNQLVLAEINSDGDYSSFIQLMSCWCQPQQQEAA